MGTAVANAVSPAALRASGAPGWTPLDIAAALEWWDFADGVVSGPEIVSVTGQIAATVLAPPGGETGPTAATVLGSQAAVYAGAEVLSAGDVFDSLDDMTTIAIVSSIGANSALIATKYRGGAHGDYGIEIVTPNLYAWWHTGRTSAITAPVAAGVHVIGLRQSDSAGANVTEWRIDGVSTAGTSGGMNQGAANFSVGGGETSLGTWGKFFNGNIHAIGLATAVTADEWAALQTYALERWQ